MPVYIYNKPGLGLPSRDLQSDMKHSQEPWERRIETGYI